MQHEFWHDKWRNNEIGFHQAQTNALLLKHWPVMQAQVGATVLVPLCGKSLDVLWFLSQGFKVIGIELSEIALDALAQSIREQLGLTVSKSTLEFAGSSFVTYRGENILLLGGDFFSVSQELLQQQQQSIDYIYDRAAIVALPTEMRERYTEHLRLLSNTAPQLLLSFDYNQNVRQGPPFSVPASEIHLHYQSYYDQLDLLEVRELIEQEPRFKAQGLESFTQLVYHLHSAKNHF